ncbi:MAG: hypothetical protein A3B30_00590 [Candidatus Komeilibacteria bacterium RIFCSPLOWO2_01_FULL_52_15]|uniref:DUF721 domain-containing protein n=1 Tax=Candidatus Komeilibacteria bacterium RIFCSPLOWO2_01_FULL_52_15 TaxID=1798551 RepID=A0A1G2BNN2_9BACT|nr:MAG: hypothetical protein A3B30_00590 [Candidatus Komeilibacteria bacterium RIFCSPLOWO2_01_FULL_52_15]
MPFTPLSGLLKHRARKRGIATKVEAAMILEYFNQVVRAQFGDEAVPSMRPLSVKNGILTVAVLSPVLEQELMLREQQLLQQVNEKAGEHAVSKLSFLS